MSGLGEIGQNGRLWAKMAIFDQFWVQNDENEIFPGENIFAIFFKTKKLVSMAKISNILWLDLEK